MTLHIADALDLPIDVVTRTIAILAIKGAGKTYTGSVLAEELLEAGLQVVVLDPTGAWWGLRGRSAADKGIGYPVVIFGGEHGDLPLDPASGSGVADAIVGQGIAAILDLSAFASLGEQRTFATAFAERLYRAKAPEAMRTPLMLIVDEADEFVPQRFTGEAAKMVGAFERLTKRGRIRAIGVTLISQRAAAVNKDVLTQCAMLIALRTIGKRDRVALEDWIEVHGSPEQRSAMMAQIASLANGNAWVFDPEHDIFQRIAVRRRRTYDSSATPEPGARRHAFVARKIDIPALREQLAASIEKAKADDPRELRRQIDELRRQQGKPAPVQTVEKIVERIVETPVLGTEERQYLEQLRTRVDTFQGTITDLIHEIQGIVRALDTVAAPAPARPVAALVPTVPAAVPSVAQRHTGRTAGLPPVAESVLTGPQGAILNALRSLEEIGVVPAEWTFIALLAHQSPRSSSFEGNLARLRALALLAGTRKAGYTLSEAGRSLTTPRHAPATDEDLWAALRQVVTDSQWRILAAMIPETRAAGTAPVAWDWIAAASGQSPNSSSFEGNLAALRRLGFIAGTRGSGYTLTRLMFLKRAA